MWDITQPAPQAVRRPPIQQKTAQKAHFEKFFFVHSHD